MKKCYLLGLTIFIVISSFSSVFAQQNILNPDDTLVNYNPDNPPATPTYGTVAKWVRTPSVNWNTSDWKAYFYKGIAFRVLFPKTYKTDSTKTYPLLLFFHGDGEKGSIYNNELQLVHCARKVMNEVNNGSFDGFAVFPQSTYGGWYSSQFTIIQEFIQYMISHVRVDRFRIIASGLSAGGDGCTRFTHAYPKLVSACISMSNTNSGLYTTANFINTVKDIPFWIAQGGKDQNPKPGVTTDGVKIMQDSGIDIRTVNLGEEGLGPESEGFYILYPNNGHNTWDATYSEPELFSYMLRAYKSNPHVYSGRREFCPGTTLNVQLELTPGFNGYEWSKNGAVIAGANTNTLIASDTGTYRARVKEGDTWSEWSPWPVHLTYKATTLTPPIQVSGLMSRVIPAPDGTTFVNLEEPAGYASYEWRNSAGQVVGSERVFKATQPGNYVATVTEVYGCSAEPSDSFYVAAATGPNAPDPINSLSGFALSQTSIQLNWNNNLHPVNNETDFEIYRSTIPDGAYQLAGIVPADTLNFVDNNLNANTLYYYKVRAVDSTAAAPVSAIDSIRTLVDKQAPTPPGHLTVLNASDNSVSLQWNASTDNASVKNYYIYINGVRSYISTDTAFTVYNLTHGTSYTFYVKAVDPTGNLSVPSNQIVASAVLDGLNYQYYTYTGESWNDLPDLSALPVAKKGKVANITLDPATQSTYYAFSFQGRIDIRQAGTYTFYTSSDDGSKLYINDSLVVNNDGLHGTQEKSGSYTFTQTGSYSFRVDYYQEGGAANLMVSWKASSLGIAKSQIPDSAFAEKVTLGGNAPDYPINITANALSYDSVKINWEDKSNNETGFEVYRATDSDGDYRIINTTPASTSSFIDTTVNASTTYYYKVQAINQYGSSGFDPGSMNGMNYSYYESGSINTMPDFNVITPVKKGNVPNITLTVKQKSTNYAMKFSGSINIPTTGQYTFYTKSDDGSNLYIDGFDTSHLVVDNNYLQSPTERSGEITLDSGIHTIFITFFQSGGGESLSASYKGPGINKQIIPDSVLANGQNKATTPAMPPLPTAPDSLSALATSPSSIGLAWDDQSDNETGFKLYRSVGDNSHYLLLESLNADTVSYVDSGLYANTTYYYKVKAVNESGASEYSSEVTVATLDHLPKLSGISDQSIRYDTTAKINVISSDEDNEPLTLGVQNLPSFGAFTDYGDGTGLLTFTPSESQQGSYAGIKVMVTDQHGGKDSVIFNLTVNDNYPPVINPIQPIQVNAPSFSSDTILSQDQNVGDSATWTTIELPDFVTAAPTPDERGLVLNINPSKEDTGHYSFQVTVTDSSGGIDEKTVNLIVNYIPPSKWYLNFATDNSWKPYPGSPWNNITGVATTHLKDNLGNTGNVGFSLLTSAWSSNSSGDQTGDNSGVYPDDVLRDFYYFGIWGKPNEVVGSVTGLDPDKKYSLTFFSSSIWTYSATGHTVFQVGSRKDSINVQSNTSNTLTFSNLTPDASGTVSFTMSKGSDAGAGFLNALVISTDTSTTPPSKPLNLQLSNKTLGLGSAVQLDWQLGSKDANSIKVYRSTNREGTYSLLNGDAKNGYAVNYLDTTVASSTTYYYYITSVNKFGTSNPSDTVSITTLKYIDRRKWYLNFATNNSWKSYPGSPWNNIEGVATTGLKDNFGNSGNVGFTLSGSWATNSSGAQTGNSSGVYPDDVLRDFYYFGIWGKPNEVAGSVTGLNPDKKYSLTFFSSSIWTYSATGHTVFQVGSRKDSINVQSNTSNTLTFSNLTPDASGTVNFTMSKGSDAGAGFLNALVISTQANIPPATPVNLLLTNKQTDEGNAVVLNWQIGSINTDSVLIYRSTDREGTFTLLKEYTLNGGTTSYVDTAVALNTVYYYYLIAANVYGISQPTDTATIMTPNDPVGVPEAPGSLVAIATSPTSINIAWEDSSSNENGFEIYRKLRDSSNYEKIAIVAADITTYNDSSVKRLTRYSYKVRAYNQYGYSLYAGPIDLTTPGLPPTIDSISDITIGQGQIYTVNLKASSSDGETLLLSVPELPTFGQFTNLGGGLGKIVFQPNSSIFGDYDVIVKAIDSSGDSSTVHFTVHVLLYNPSFIAPTNIVTTANSNNEITLSWTNNVNDPSGTEIWRSLSADGPYSYDTTLQGDLVTYKDSGLSPNTKYFYKLRSLISEEKSKFSEFASATTFLYSIYVNFNLSNPAPSPWNNLNTIPQIGDRFNLVDNKGKNTGIVLENEGGFSGINPYGVNTGNNSGVYPDNVISVTYWVDASDTGKVTLTGLNLTMSYDLTFFGSRTSSYDRTTTYLANGQSASLQVANDSTQTVTIHNVSPNVDGNINIGTTQGGASPYGYIGALVIQAHNNYDDSGNVIYNPSLYLRTRPSGISKGSINDTSSIGSFFQLLKAYPNPFRQDVNITMNCQANDKLIFNLYGSNGSLADRRIKNVAKGVTTITYRPGSTIPPGIYILNIRSVKTGKTVNVKLIKQ